VNKWRGSQQVPILHGISRERYAMHATQLFIDRLVVPHARGTLDRKSTLFKLIVKFFWTALFSCFGMIVCIQSCRNQIGRVATLFHNFKANVFENWAY